METKQSRTADFLFAVQLTGMAVFVYGQSMRMLQTMQGVSAAWIACMTAFTAINVGLAYRGWRQSPTRANLQLCLTYGLWTVSLSLLMTIVFVRISALNWGPDDNICTALVAIGVAVTLAVGRGHKLGISDPLVRGTLAAIFRGIPHLALAYKIGLLGGAGIAAMTVWSGHLTSGTRVGQLFFAVREGGWNRARTGLALAEGVNVASWIFVTVVWLLA